MSVVNMFRKEALRHQYKSQEYGHSVIKQPLIITKAIAFVAIVLVISVIFFQFVTFSTKHAYVLTNSAENYQPIVISEPSIISSQLVSDGARVNKNQPVISVDIIDKSVTDFKSLVLKAPESGHYFHAETDSQITTAYQPIGYVLKNKADRVYFFWLAEQPKKRLRVGQQVDVKIKNHSKSGRISTVIGPIIDGRGQKIAVKFDDFSGVEFLSPLVPIKMTLQQQPKSLSELLGIK